MASTKIIVMSDEGLAVQFFGPYENIRIDGGVVFMREDEYAALEKCYKIPDGYTLEFYKEEQGGFDQ